MSATDAGNGTGRTGTAPRAAILGCAGHGLTEDERRLFRDADPLGLILFARNCGTAAQIRGLIADFRGTVGRPDAPVLIDQEGGRVARLKAPRWHPPPAAARIGALHAADPAAGRRLAWLAGRVIAADLHELGISVACTPVLDVQQPDAHQVIGDRSYGSDPAAVATLGRAVASGVLAGGVLPVIKHIPGHGRAHADSHLELPVVEAGAEGLDACDLAPFRALADMPIAMTAHVLYPAWDDAAPATVSARVIADVIRRRVGFDGLLLSDDLGMSALGGSVAERARAALAAGCDVALQCNGELADMAATAAAARPMDGPAVERWRRARSLLHAPEPFDLAAGLAEMAVLAGRLEA